MAKDQNMTAAQRLLHEYRPTIWRKSLLETVAVGGDNTLQACDNQLRFTQELVRLLRNSKFSGEKLHWIVFASYMTEQQMGDTEEILSYIAHHYEPIPRRTFFRLRGRAIQMLDEMLNEMIGKGAD